MRPAPKYTAATLEMLMVSSTAGNITAIIRPVFSDVSVRSALPLPKRTASSGSRTKARTTRMPLICSRSTWFTRSMRFCIFVNCGCMRIATWPTLSSRIGMATRRISESGPSSRTAKITPPMIMIGAVTNRVSVIKVKTCTWVTSLVRRVINDGAPNWPTSRAEYPITVWNRSRRTSRPKPIAERAPKNVAATAKQTCTRVTASITAPTFQM